MPTINGSLMPLSSRQAVAGLIISLPVSFFMCGDTLFEVTAQTSAIFFVIFDDGSGNTVHQVGRLPARFAKNQARTPTAWATFTASAVDIIAVSVSIDVFFRRWHADRGRCVPVTPVLRQALYAEYRYGPANAPKHWRPVPAPGRNP